LRPDVVIVLLISLLVLSPLSMAPMTCAAPDALYDSAWPKARCDERNSGLCPYSADHNDGTLRWTFKAGGRINNEPVIGQDGAVYVLSTDGNLSALSKRGSELWSYRVGTCYGSPAIGRDGTIYVPTWMSGLIALRPGGNLAWSLPDCEGETSVVIGTDGTLYVGCRSGGLWAVAPDGTKRWNIEELNGYWGGMPAIAPNGNIVLAVEEERRVVEVSPDGRIQLEFETGGLCSGVTVLDVEGNLYVATYTMDYKGHLESYDDQGELRWQVELEQWIRGSPALGPHGEVFVMVKDARLHAFSSAGEELWNVSTADWGPMGPSVAKDGTVFTGTREGRLLAIRDGRVRWSYQAPESVDEPPALDSNGIVYAVAHDGTLIALGKERPVSLESEGMASSLGLLLAIVAVVVIAFGAMVLVRRRRDPGEPRAAPPPAPAEQPYEPWKAPSADPEASQGPDAPWHDAPGEGDRPPRFWR